MTSDESIAQTLLDIARSRRRGAAFSPAEAARRLSPADWRPLVDDVRRVAGRLQRDGLINVTQKGRAVDAIGAHGPIRLSRPLH